MLRLKNISFTRVSIEVSFVENSQLSGFKMSDSILPQKGKVNYTAVIRFTMKVSENMTHWKCDQYRREKNKVIKLDESEDMRKPV